MENKTFDIDVGTACAANDILKLGSSDHITVPVERVQDDGSCRKIEALRVSAMRS